MYRKLLAMGKGLAFATSSKILYIFYPKWVRSPEKNLHIISKIRKSYGFYSIM